MIVAIQSSMVLTLLVLALLIFPMKKLLQFFIIFQTFMVCLGWLGNFYAFIVLPIRMLLCGFALFGIYRLRKSWKKLLLIVAIFQTSLLGFLVLQKFTRELFYLLALGYDNSSHLAFLYRASKVGGFEFGFKPKMDEIEHYSNIFDFYPSLQMQTWNFIIQIFGIELHSTVQLINSFVFLTLLTWILLIITMSSFRQAGNARITHIAGAAITSIIFLFFSIFSNLLWIGFPPTVWGILNCVVMLRLFLLPAECLHSRIAMLSFGVSNVIYSYQIFFPPMLLLIVVAYWQMVRTRRAHPCCRHKLFWNILSAGSISSIFVFAFLSLKEYGNSLFNYGGIMFPHWLVIVSLFILTVLLFDNKSGIETKTHAVLFFLTLIYGITLATVGNFLGLGTYYPTKVIFLSLVVGFSFVLKSTSSLDRDTSLLKLKTKGSITTVLILATCVPSLFLQGYKEPFNGQTVSVVTHWDEIVNGEISPFQEGCLSSIYDISQSTEEFGYNHKVINFVVTEKSTSDLLSRWANSLQGRIDNVTLDFTIQLSGVKDYTLLVSEYAQKFPEFSLVNLTDRLSRSCQKI